MTLKGQGRIIGMTVLALAGTFAGLESAEAQIVPSLPPIVLRGSLSYGCNWIQSIDAVNRNTGYPDTHAEYQVSAMPVYVPDNVGKITLRGKYAHTRYFTFSSYDGFRPGNLTDSIQDYQLTPRRNGVPVGSPNTTPGPLPNSGNYLNDWQITLKYDFPPAPPLAREPDTLYMGTNNTKYLGLTFPDVFGNKQLTYRIYLPDTGANEFGDVDLPQITYTAADGSTIDVNHANPQQAQCNQLARGQDLLLITFPEVKFNGPANVTFLIDPSISTFHTYPNGGTNYARGPANVIYADMVVARFKVPPTPNEPGPALVRYQSLCVDQFDNTAVVACLADREFVRQADGYITTVISTNAKRPVKASPAFGYNYLPWGPASEVLVYLRQILADPDFVGNYKRGVGKSGAALTAVLGEWAPDISYCDTQTFDATANQGGAALLAACKANYVPFKNGVNHP